MGSISHVLLLVGSPRKCHSAHLAGLISRGVEVAGATADVFYLSDHEVGGCIACDACMSTGECVIDDDFTDFERLMDEADGLIVCSPIYFSGPPSQLKALYDRMQARWARRYILGQPADEKRPATLCVLGGGHDPFGYDPIRTITTSALNIAGFRLGQVEAFIGFGEGGAYDPDEEDRAVTLGTAFVRADD